MQHTFNTVHGSNTRDYTVAIDGMGVTSSLGDGSNLAVYHNEGAYDEVSYQTSGISAEVSSGGIRVNLIPREGGNRFRLFGFASYAPVRCRASIACSTTTRPSADRSCGTSSGSFRPADTGV